jgi:hypothetical protein
MFTTILGGVSIGLMIELKDWDTRNIVSLSIFIVMQFFFLVIIHLIGYWRSEIKKVIHKRNFAFRYILRGNIKKEIKEVRIHIKDPTPLRFEQKFFDDVESSMDADSFHESNELRQKIQDIFDNDNLTSTNFSDNERLKAIYHWVSNTGSSVDWLILHNLLSQDWSSFGLFGIEFSDGTALRKAFIATLGIVASSTFAGGIVQFLNLF